MPESIPVFDALDASPALQIDCADVNIAELPQDVDALKSIIARLISKASQQERVIAEQLVEKDRIAVIHSIEQQRMAAAHAAEHAKLKAEFELRIQKIYESIVLARPSSTVSGWVFRKVFGFQWFRGFEVRLCNGTFPRFPVDFASVFGVE